jgi:hypothetical protein
MLANVDEEDIDEVDEVEHEDELGKEDPVETNDEDCDVAETARFREVVNRELPMTFSLSEELFIPVVGMSGPLPKFSRAAFFSPR